jgi:hypothetical protein
MRLRPRRKLGARERSAGNDRRAKHLWNGLIAANAEYRAVIVAVAAACATENDFRLGGGLVVSPLGVHCCVQREPTGIDELAVLGARRMLHQQHVRDARDLRQDAQRNHGQLPRCAEHAAG